MEPTNYETKVELPEPVATDKESASFITPEMVQNNSSMAPVVSSIPQNNIAQQTVVGAQQPAQPAPGSDDFASALIADDADLIEKEWVLKAKAIVAQTAHDPNAQTKEVVKMKSEYLKKRYNKQLKMDET